MAEESTAAPVQPVVPPPTSVLAFVTSELRALKSATTEGVWTRAGLLAALSERIRVHLGQWEASREPKHLRQTLADLSTRLATPTADQAEVDRRWHGTITTLESLTTTQPDQPPRRRAFWKR